MLWVHCSPGRQPGWHRRTLPAVPLSCSSWSTVRLTSAPHQPRDLHLCLVLQPQPPQHAAHLRLHGARDLDAAALHICPGLGARLAQPRLHLQQPPGPTATSAHPAPDPRVPQPPGKHVTASAWRGRTPPPPPALGRPGGSSFRPPSRPGSTLHASTHRASRRGTGRRHTSTGAPSISEVMMAWCTWRCTSPPSSVLGAKGKRCASTARMSFRRAGLVPSTAKLQAMLLSCRAGGRPHGSLNSSGNRQAKKTPFPPPHHVPHGPASRPPPPNAAAPPPPTTPAAARSRPASCGSPPPARSAGAWSVARQGGG